MKRIHLSPKPIGSLYDTAGSNRVPRCKPHGLWYSLENSWKEFCLEADFMKQKVTSAMEYEVDVSGCNLFVIDTVEKINGFTKNYQMVSEKWSNGNMDWPRLLAEGFDGYEVALFDRGLLDGWFTSMSFDDYANIRWYRNLDCPSGCIWNATKVKLSLLETTPA